ncbi:hypothetical protein [Thalassomonas haliotis]|uniref:Uncharacterized protein n=1 Tax=Thalassomonas haliotis TaxID=485448 RepID=A0ABY7VBA8_9GAMM|nr:hypothetical protein [Thalassomonas haliotis]WDE10590.1 hypothetical protein H3N35_20355 [Thalassomonas haliotis]
MLIISGSAEYMAENEKFTKGDRHMLTLFLQKGELEDNLDNIESFLINLGWDEILIEQTEWVADNSTIEHSILQQAYAKAEIQGLSLVAFNEPLACAA